MNQNIPNINYWESNIAYPQYIVDLANTLIQNYDYGIGMTANDWLRITSIPPKLKYGEKMAMLKAYVK